MGKKIYYFKCTNRRCHQRGKEVTTVMGPAEIRAAIGTFVRCVDCLWVLHLVKVQPITSDVLKAALFTAGVL